jgi:hypothetical protein
MMEEQLDSPILKLMLEIQLSMILTMVKSLNGLKMKLEIQDLLQEETILEELVKCNMWKDTLGVTILSTLKIAMEKHLLQEKTTFSLLDLERNHSSVYQNKMVLL